jgi:hypothetical protein
MIELLIACGTRAHAVRHILGGNDHSGFQSDNPEIVRPRWSRGWHLRIGSVAASLACRVTREGDRSLVPIGSSVIR